MDRASFRVRRHGDWVAWRVGLLVVAAVAVFSQAVLRIHPGEDLAMRQKIVARHQQHREDGHGAAAPAPSRHNRLCVYVQSNGIDYDRANYTEQRWVNAATWAAPYRTPQRPGDDGGTEREDRHHHWNDRIRVVFVTDGSVPEGFDRIALNTTGIHYNLGSQAFWRLLEHLRERERSSPAESIHGEGEENGEEEEEEFVCDFFAFTDSDVYLQPDRILESLEDVDPSSSFYGGNTYFDGPCDDGEHHPFVHGMLMLLSRKTLLESLQLEACREEQRWNKFFDVFLSCCLYDHRFDDDDDNTTTATVHAVRHGHYIAENKGDIRKAYFSGPTERERGCALSVHKIQPITVAFAIRDDLRRISRGTAAEDCSSLWFGRPCRNNKGSEVCW